jgi:hypothetical protein
MEKLCAYVGEMLVGFWDLENKFHLSGKLERISPDDGRSDLKFVGICGSNLELGLRRCVFDSPQSPYASDKGMEEIIFSGKKIKATHQIDFRMAPIEDFIEAKQDKYEQLLTEAIKASLASFLPAIGYFSGSVCVAIRFGGELYSNLPTINPRKLPFLTWKQVNIAFYGNRQIKFGSGIYSVICPKKSRQ